jgi:hypothetical protein
MFQDKKIKIKNTNEEKGLGNIDSKNIVLL